MIFDFSHEEWVQVTLKIQEADEVLVGNMIRHVQERDGEKEPCQLVPF